MYMLDPNKKTCGKCRHYWWCSFWSDVMLNTLFTKDDGLAGFCPACPKFKKKFFS